MQKATGTDTNTNPGTGAESEQGAAQPPPLLRLAFRPFFLLGAFFSVASLVLWAGVVTGLWSFSVYGGPLWWHAHEMLFGFVCAIALGFLLTAVQSWTGVRGLNGAALALLVMLWLLARIAMLLPQLLHPALIAALDVAFLPVAAVLLARPIVRVRQWRNLIFLPLLLTMAACNVAMHRAAWQADAVLQAQAGNAMVMLVVLLMTVVAGRVVPMFTANGTGTARVADLPWLERAALLSMLLAVAASLGARFVDAALLAGCYALAAALHAWRALRWRFHVTLRTPLVWSLHLSYFCIPVGLSMLALAATTSLVTQTQALHALTVGAMGTMILSMMTRVSRGHTGRPLLAGGIMTAAFVTMLGAFVVRVFGSYWIDDYRAVIMVAVSLWVLAYGSFCVLYLPVLTRARADGRPG